MSLPDTCESRQGRATLELDRRFPVIKEKHTFTLVIIELPLGGYLFYPSRGSYKSGDKLFNRRVLHKYQRPTLIATIKRLFKTQNVLEKKSLRSVTFKIIALHIQAIKGKNKIKLSKNLIAW